MNLYLFICGMIFGAAIMAASWLIGDSATDKDNDYCRYGKQNDDVDDG